MSDVPAAAGGGHPRSLERVMEDVCDRAEAAWKEGGRPEIEDALGEVPEAARPALLRSLLVLELAYLRRRGEWPTPEEYRRRFPARVAVIDAVLGVPPPSPRAGTDHTLLYAILALQNELIDRDI